MVFGGQHLVFLRSLGAEQYQPVTVAADYDTATVYFPRAKAVYDGQWKVGDINLIEYQGSPAPMPMLNPIVMGTLSRLLGSMKAGVIVSDFLFPPIIFLLFYSFIFMFSQRKFLSLFVSSLFIFVINLPFWELHHLFKPPLVGFIFRRFEYPQITMPFYLLAAYFTYLAIQKRRTSFMILAGIFAGSLFYTYLYDWVSFFTGLGFLFSFLLVARKWEAAKQIAGIIAIGLFLSSFYWANFFTLTHLPQYHDIVSRIGVEISHSVRFFTWKFYLRIALFAVMVYYTLRKRDSVSAMYLIAFLVPTFVTLNLQVLIGMNPQPDHWGRTAIPFAYASLTMAAIVFHERYLKRISFRMLTVGSVVVLVLLFSLEIFYVFRIARLTQARHVIPSDRAASYRWIRDNLTKTTVIGTLSPLTNLDMQLYIDNKLFLPFSINTVASNEEIWQRFFYLIKLYNISPDGVRQLFANQEGVPYHEQMSPYLFQNTFYGNKLNSFFVDFDETKRIIPPKLIDEKIRQYSKLDGMKPAFKLDYVYYGPNEKLLGGEDPIKQNSKLQEVYKDEHVRVYKF